jgi:hypothetical protein
MTLNNHWQTSSGLDRLPPVADENAKGEFDGKTDSCNFYLYFHVDCVPDSARRERAMSHMQRDALNARNFDLFMLCEVWVAGLLPSEEFLIRTMAPRGADLKEEVWETDPQRAKSLTQEFYHAQRCVLAVAEAIEAIERLGFGEEVSYATRAHFFGKFLSSENAVRCLDWYIGVP